MGRSWRESWVSGEGRVDRAGSDDESQGQVLPRGCYLGVPHVRYLWWVHVTGRGPRVECLHGTKLRDGRYCDGTGYQVFHRADHRLALL
jgi:hypothetical protein